jgi:hypothetical protein
VSKRKSLWKNGNMIWVWVFLIGGAVIGIIAKGAILLNDLERREERVVKLESYKTENEKVTVEMKKDIEYVKDKVDNIDKKLDRALRR